MGVIYLGRKPQQYGCGAAGGAIAAKHLLNANIGRPLSRPTHVCLYVCMHAWTLVPMMMLMKMMITMNRYHYHLLVFNVLS